MVFIFIINFDYIEKSIENPLLNFLLLNPFVYLVELLDIYYYYPFFDSLDDFLQWLNTVNLKLIQFSFA